MSGRKRHIFPADYVSDDGILVPAGAKDHVFSYNDGDASENYLLEMIAKAADRSLFATDMLSGIRDWASLYHLSPKRANLLRPFSDLLRGNILEVGAGCGAITRFLGENGGRIVAVEGSIRRARIAQQRTRDLNNVQVICDRIENVEPVERFDVVTAIGVLEYAAIYGTDPADPHVGLLKRLRELLTPQGVVILAIENKLGLKYFAGAREDHTGAAFDGINDGYRQGSVATFGAAELSRLLDRAGLRARTWFVPCPDYKLPTTILSAPLLNRYPDLAATLVAQAAPVDPQRPVDPTFSLEQGWSVLGSNALLGELANSFLVVAGTSAEAVAPYQYLADLAWHYSVDRHPAFAKETRFTRAGSDVAITRHALTRARPPAVPIRQVFEPEPLRRGNNWWNELVAILNTAGWSTAQIAGWARVWTDALTRECGISALNGETFRTHVDGRHFDLAPFNMVRGADGQTHFFDQEWHLTPTVELGYLVVRGLRDSLWRVPSCAAPASETPLAINALVINVLAELGILLSRAEIDRYALMEGQIQAWVQGRATSGTTPESIQAQWNDLLRQRAPAERDALVQERNRLHGDLERARQQLSETDAARAGLVAELAETRAAAVQQADDIARLDALRIAHEARIAEAGRDLQAARELARDSQGQMQHLAGELAGAQQDLARMAQEYATERTNLTAANEERDRRIATLAQELATEQHRLQQRVADLDALSAERDAQLHARDAQLQERAAQLDALAAASKAQLDALAAERDAILSEAGRAATEHDSQIANLTQELAAEQQRVAELGALSAERDAQLHARDAQLQERAAQLDALAATSKAQLDALAAEHDAIRQKSDRAATERDAAARQAAQLFSEIGKLQPLVPQLDAQTARAQRAEDETARLRADRDAGRAALAKREQERDAQARDAQIAKAQSEQLRAALLQQAQAIAALTPAPRRSPTAAFRALTQRVSRWQRVDYRQQAWEAQAIRASGLFSALDYLTRYPDVAAAGIDPLLHYLRFGAAEGRSPHPLFDGDYYLKHYPEAAEAKMSALAHYASAGVAAGFDPHPLFDTDWYLQQNPDVAATGINPLHHYMTHGWREGRNPHPLFDTSFYLEQNPDVASAGENPLLHYWVFGWKEGRNPHPEFDASWYLEQNKDVAEAGIEPLLHYVTHGRREGRHTSRRARGTLTPPTTPPEHVWGNLPKLGNVRTATVDVIVPVYRGYNDTLACIYSVLSSEQSTQFELVVINDAGPDEALNQKLDALSKLGLFTYLKNDTNLGFVRTVNRSLNLHSDRDAILLNCDTVVYSNWVDRILRHAEEDETIATITPLSNNATICSYPHTDKVNRDELEVPLARIDAYTAACNKGSRSEVPTGVGFCFYMRRRTISEIGAFDYETFGQGYGEENDFCMRAKKAGYKNVFAHDVFVYHTGEQSFAETTTERRNKAQILLDQKHPEYHRLVQEYIGTDPSRLARARLDAFRVSKFLPCAPTIFVTHTWGGGIEKHTRDLRETLKQEGIPVLTLRVGGNNRGSIRLDINEGELTELQLPNLSDFDLQEDRFIIEALLQTLKPRSLHVHSVAGLHSNAVSSLFEIIRTSQIPYYYTWHDFSALCHRNHFVTSNRRYCGEPPLETCRECLRSDPEAIDQFDPAERRKVFGDLIKGAEYSMVPSESTADRAATLDSRDRILVRPHAEFTNPNNWVTFPPPNTRPLRVALIGAIGPHKGSDVLSALLHDAEARKLAIQYVLVGYTDQSHLSSYENFKSTGPYSDDEEAIRQLREVQPHLCLFPSIWPETYCYALSVAFECGIPPLVFDLGAQAERVRNARWGRVLPAAISQNPSKLNDLILNLRIDDLWAERTESNDLFTNSPAFYSGITKET